MNILLNTTDKTNAGFKLNTNGGGIINCVECKLTQRQYLLIKDFISSKTLCDILISYESVLNAKKNATPKTCQLQNLKQKLNYKIIISYRLQIEISDREPSDSTNNLILIRTLMVVQLKVNSNNLFQIILVQTMAVFHN